MLQKKNKIKLHNFILLGQNKLHLKIFHYLYTWNFNSSPHISNNMQNILKSM